ncbi:MAG: restriction endonuclease subunit S [Colwellia sp.]|nr:restriction endonuclease subunit S [Colwellia sp.]
MSQLNEPQINTDEHRKNTPQLRFPEFRDDVEWNLSTIAEISSVSSGGTPSRAKTEYWNGNIPWVSTTLIDFNTIHSANEYITGTGLNNSSTKIFPKNTILMAMYGQGKTRGKVAVLGIEAAINQACAAITLKKGMNTNFVFQNLAARYDELRKISNQGGQENLSGTLIKAIPFVYPDIKTKEQQKIANCLASLDELISAQSQKIKALKTHKKGLMQQLFPSGGETVPKLRFPEFINVEKWKIKPFNKLLTIGNGKDYKHLSDGDVPIYGSGGYMRSVDSYLYDGESACIGRKGTINRPMFLTGKFWTVDTLFYTHSFKGCLPKFIYLIFQNINWLSHNEAGGVPSLSKANIGKIEVAVPKLSEQQKIADFISTIDDLVKIQSKKVELLKTHKKGLMQQLFPSNNDELNV